jgi:DNA-binding SARP family transcriptional activator/WD40 repeat protein
MAVVKFKTLGALDLRRPDGSEIHSLLVQPKRLALLVYLCAGRPLGFHRRDTLLALLWPESDPGHARTSLRSSLHGLRRSLGESTVKSRGDEEVSVNFDEISCDAVEFEDLVGAGRLAEALELYRGGFLTGVWVAGANSFERWVDSERARLRGLAVKAAHTLSEQAESRRSFGDAVRFARLALNLCDGDEKEVRRLIMALLASGDRPAALHAYDEFSNRVAEEFETQPSPETTALISAFRSDVGVGPARSTSPFQQTPATKTGLSDGDSHSQESSRQGARASTARFPFGRRPYALLGILAGILGVAALIATRGFPRRPVDPETRRKITSVGTAMMASLSPDGEFLAYVTQSADSQHVVVEDIVAGTQRILDSEKGAILSLEWSPDGTRLLMGSVGRAVVIPRLGDSSRTIGPDTHDQPLAYWLPDSVRLSVHSAPDRRVLVFDPRTQDTLPLPVTGKYTWLNEGSWSPTGRVFAAMLEWNNPLGWEIRAVSMDSANHSIVRDTVTIGSPRWSRDGHFLYYARGFNSLWRVPVDPNNGAPLGAPEEIADDLQMYSQRFGLVHFAISADGRSVLYSRGARYSNIWIVQSTSPTSPPRTIQLTNGTLLRWSPVASPDGKWIAFAQ